MPATTPEVLRASRGTGPRIRQAFLGTPRRSDVVGADRCRVRGGGNVVTALPTVQSCSIARGSETASCSPHSPGGHRLPHQLPAHARRTRSPHRLDAARSAALATSVTDGTARTAMGNQPRDEDVTARRLPFDALLVAKGFELGERLDKSTPPAPEGFRRCVPALPGALGCRHR